MAKGNSGRDRKGRGEAPGEGRAARRRGRTLFIEFTAVFAAAAVVIVLAAGFTLGGYLTSGIQADAGTVQQSVFMTVGASLAALYLVLALLVRRGSEAIRCQQADSEGRSDEMKNRYESIVAVLCAALDLRDNVTQGHARRVSEIASVVAWQMGLRKDQLRQVEKAAILHDIGKIGVADAVLSKPGPLNESEWEEMRRHPELGRRVLNGIDFLQDAAEVVYAHHERWDGQGYPLGLRGEEIPLGARIFAVVDAYSAMTSHRPYRKAMPHGKAIDEILRNAGGQFDPAVVRVFAEAERQGLIDEDQNNGHGRRFGHRVLQRAEEIGPAADEKAAPVCEETVPAGGE